MLHIIMSAVNYLLWIIAMLIVVDSIMSWIPGAAGSRFGEMISTLVTPVIAPIRRIFMRFEFARSSPVDFFADGGAYHYFCNPKHYFDILIFGAQCEQD